MPSARIYHLYSPWYLTVQKSTHAAYKQGKFSLPLALRLEGLTQITQGNMALILTSMSSMSRKFRLI